jgi:hypothetical protein
MATLANIFDRFIGAGSAAGDLAGAVTRETAEAYRLRSLPYEDIFLYVKRIDNSRVVRQTDPTARARDWKMGVGAGLAAVALIGLLLPGAYGLVAGYQLSSLRQEHEQLKTEGALLALEEARYVSAERLEKLAEMQKFVDPTPDRTIYLPKSGDSLALNRR